MTSTSFMKHFATEAGISQTKAKEVLSVLDSALKSYIKGMESGDSVKVMDTTYKVVTVPERSGVNYLQGGSTWTKPEHDTVKVSVSNAIKEVVSD